MQERTEIQKLQEAYRRAWHRFVVAVYEWQSRNAEDMASRELDPAVAEAEFLYRKSRNELANYMISSRSRESRHAGRFEAILETFNRAAASVGSESRPEPSDGLERWPQTNQAQIDRRNPGDRVAL